MNDDEDLVAPDGVEVPRGAGSGRDVVPFSEAVRVWFAISLQTFGGPAGQIAVMQHALVEQKRWIGQRRFLHALSFCTLLPGPEAQQLAIYIGWLLNGTRGGLVAGSLFVLPGMVALMVLSAIYVAWGQSTVVTAGGLGLGRWAPGTMRVAEGGEAANSQPPLIADDVLHSEDPSWGHAAKVLSIGLLAWGVPIAGAVILTGRHSVFTQQGVFFSGAAVVTFGGAYAVLAYVAQRAVEVYGWLTPSEMVRGLALAETTPGPLIMVVQYVAFLGAYRHPGSISPWVAAVVAALLTTWVTFVPCFIFIFLGAPSVEKLRGNHAISNALRGVTAAVVGVIANLGLYFAVHTLFGQVSAQAWGPVSLQVPHVDTLRPVAVVIALVAAVLLFRYRWSVPRTLGVCAALGLVAALLPV